MPWVDIVPFTNKLFFENEVFYLTCPFAILCLDCQRALGLIEKFLIDKLRDLVFFNEIKMNAPNHCSLLTNFVSAQPNQVHRVTKANLAFK